MEAQNVLIRDEKDTDYRVISDVTKSAFETMEISNHTEQFIIDALRSAKALTVSLVAEIDGLGTYTRRIVTFEKTQSERLLPGRASRILSTIWV